MIMWYLIYKLLSVTSECCIPVCVADNEVDRVAAGLLAQRRPDLPALTQVPYPFM